MRVSRIVLAILVAVAVLTSVLPAQAVPITGSWMNIPKRAGGSKAQQYVTLNQIAAAVDGAPSGSTISVSMYTQNRAWLLDRFAKAYRRGVNVRYVTWKQGDSAALRKLTKVLGTDQQKRSWVKVCAGSCRRNGSAGVHHAKAVTFSATGTARWVTMIMSGNLTRSAAESQWNEHQVIVGSPKVYNSVTGFILSLGKDRWQGVQPTLTSGPYKIYYFPQSRPQDPILSDLRAVKCKYGPGGRYRTKVRMLMAFWTGYRNATTRRLGVLRRQGCDVQVIYTGRNTSAAVKRVLRAGRVPSWDSDRGLSLYAHAKSVYIGGTVARRVQWINYTGSQNMTRAGQRYNDDILLRTLSQAQFRAHLVQFELVKRTSRRQGW